jgi:hypothetical protein
LTSDGLKEVAREVGDAFSGALSGDQPKQATRSNANRPSEQTPRRASQFPPSGTQSNPSGRRGA